MNLDLSGFRAAILCEDQAHYDFIRGYLKAVGMNQRNIKRISNAFNNGTVLKEYPNAIKSYRKHFRQNVLLVVMRDADNLDGAQALRLFDKAVDLEKYQLNQPTRTADEKILIFCPVRNIESWFYYIDTGNTGAEIKNQAGVFSDYKIQYKSANPAQLAGKLRETLCSHGLPDSAPPSLLLACKELQRLQ